jgi:hypothetical protein
VHRVTAPGLHEPLAVCSTCNDVHSYLTTQDSQNILETFLSTDNPGSALSANLIPRPTLPNGQLRQNRSNVREPVQFLQTAIEGISSLMYDTFTSEGLVFINGVYIDASSEFSTNVQHNPPASQRLWASQDLELSFQSFAVSMSNAIRARSDNNTIETGQEGSSVAKFFISWPWIALPMLVILAGLAQFVVAIFLSRTVSLWKESTFIVLSRGRLVDGLFDQASTARDMRVAAGRTKVNHFEDKMERGTPTPSTFERIDTEYRS